MKCEGVEIGPADPTSSAEIKRHLRTTFEEHRARDPAAFPERRFAKLERSLAAAFDPQQRSYSLRSARRDGRLVGYVLVRYFHDVSMVGDIWVDPGERGRGVGGALLADVVERAANDGRGCLYASVWEGNEASHRLFQRMDFTATRSPAIARRLFPRLRATTYVRKLENGSPNSSEVEPLQRRGKGSLVAAILFLGAGGLAAWLGR